MRTQRVGEAEQAVPRDSGHTLTEVLVAIVLIGIAVIPIMMAGIVTIKASTSSRNAAKVETVLANAADRVNRAGESCDYDVYVEAAAQAEGWDPSLATASYSYYVPADSPITLGTWVPGACPIGTRPEGLVQKVTITVTDPSGSPVRTMEVVKSDV